MQNETQKTGEVEKLVKSGALMAAQDEKDFLKKAQSLLILKDKIYSAREKDIEALNEEIEEAETVYEGVRKKLSRRGWIITTAICGAVLAGTLMMGNIEVAKAYHSGFRMAFDSYGFMDQMRLVLEVAKTGMTGNGFIAYSLGEIAAITTTIGGMLGLAGIPLGRMVAQETEPAGKLQKLVERKQDILQKAKAFTKQLDHEIDLMDDVQLYAQPKEVRDEFRAMFNFVSDKHNRKDARKHETKVEESLENIEAGVARVQKTALGATAVLTAATLSR